MCRQIFDFCIDFTILRVPRLRIVSGSLFYRNSVPYGA